MSRLPLLSLETDDPAVKILFDEVRARGIAVPNLYRVIGHSPQMLRAWLDFAWPLRLHAKTSRALRELLILRGAQVSGAHYEWVHHVEMALAAGISQAQIDALPQWQTSPLFDKGERAVIRLADEVTRGPAASAECIAELKTQGFDPSDIVELTLTASFYVCVSRFLLSMDIELEAADKQFAITRSFKAPLARVWKAWSEPEQFAKWWGPKGCTLGLAKMQFVPGGENHYSMSWEGGGVWWGKFVYHRITPMDSFEFVNSFADAQGNIARAPFFEDWPLQVFNTVYFSEQDGRTIVTLRGGPINATEAERARFASIFDSMNQGFGGTFDQLDEFLAGA